jgi:phosphoglycolate phosphatase
MIGDGAPVLLQRALRLVGAGHDPAALMARYGEHYAANTRGLTKLYPDVAPTLRELAEAGCRMGRCTNKPYRPTLDVLEAFGLSGFFSAVVAGDTMDKRKPDPAPLLEVVRRLGGMPASAVLIGDSAVD